MTKTKYMMMPISPGSHGVLKEASKRSGLHMTKLVDLAITMAINTLFDPVSIAQKLKENIKEEDNEKKN